MPGVQKQLIPIPFTGGVDTKSDFHQVLAGNLLTLENGQFNKKGQINKRFGYDLLGKNIEGGSNIITKCQGISVYNNELLLFDGVNYFSFINATQTWVNRGNHISLSVDNKQIIRTTQAQQLNPDCALATNGVEVIAWEDSRGGVRYSTLDFNNQSFIANDQIVDVNGAKPKCIFFNNTLFIFYIDNGGDLFYKTINPNIPSMISEHVNAALDGYGSNFVYDVCITNNKLYVAYCSNHTASGEIRFFSYDTNMNKSFVHTVDNTDAVATCINIVNDSNSNNWISWGTNTGHVRTSAWSISDSSFLSSIIVDTLNIATITGIEQVGNKANLQLIYEAVHGANPFTKSITVSQTGSAVVVGTLRSVGLASKAFNMNGNIFVNCAYQSNLQSTYFTVLLNSFSIVAKINHQLGGGLRTNNMLSQSNLSGTNVVWANLVKGSIISEANTLFTLLGANSTTLDFESSTALHVTQSNNLLIAGSILQNYDGVSIVEHGFHVYPENIQAIVEGSDGSLSTGTYQYRVVYQWSDNWGQIQRSAPSPAITVEVVAGQHVRLILPTLRLTAKQGIRPNVNIVIYRTAADEVNFNRVTSTVVPLVNDTTVDSVEFVDVDSDIAIAANELIYTSGGVLQNISPPANSLISIYQNRVILGGLEDPNLLWFSQNKFDNSNFNTIPAEFCAELTIGCDPRGGKITALGLLDDKLIIFKETAIFVLTGDGPNATGGGSVFPDPQMLTSDVGCNNPASVVIMPQGLMFQSDKGIYLLDRSLAVNYIGAPVEQFNNLMITHAVLIPDANQVIFSTGSGRTLMFDYYFNQWSTWTNQYAVDCDVVNNMFIFASANGNVYQQNPNSFTDNGKSFSLSWTIPHLAFAGLNAYQRVFRCWLLGTFKGPHKLKIEVSYDYNPTYLTSAIIDATDIITMWGSDSTWGTSSPWGGTYIPYEFRINFNRQKCTAISLRISDEQDSGFNEGYAISALTFEVGTLPSGNRLPTVQNVGTQ